MKKYIIIFNMLLTFMFAANAFALSFIDYFPVQVGNQWTYVGPGTPPSYTATYSISGTQDIGGTTTYHWDQAPWADWYLTNDANGFRIYGETAEPPDTGIDLISSVWQVVSADFSVNDTISGTYNTNYDITSTIVGFETVDVPAYEGTALKLKLDFYDNYSKLGHTEYAWFAEDIGLVKTTNTTTIDDFMLGFNMELTDYNIVPIPGAVWLLGSGLIGLVALRRKSS